MYEKAFFIEGPSASVESERANMDAAIKTVSPSFWSLPMGSRQSELDIKQRTWIMGMQLLKNVLQCIFNRNPVGHLNASSRPVVVAVLSGRLRFARMQLLALLWPLARSWVRTTQLQGPSESTCET